MSKQFLITTPVLDIQLSNNNNPYRMQIQNDVTYLYRAGQNLPQLHVAGQRDYNNNHYNSSNTLLTNLNYRWDTTVPVNIPRYQTGANKYGASNGMTSASNSSNSSNGTDTKDVKVEDNKTNGDVTPPGPSPSPTPSPTPTPTPDFKCSLDQDCINKDKTRPYCGNGTCVQCINNAHCVGGVEVCSNGKCVSRLSPQCPY